MSDRAAAGGACGGSERIGSIDEALARLNEQYPEVAARFSRQDEAIAESSEKASGSRPEAGDNRSQAKERLQRPSHRDRLAMLEDRLGDIEERIVEIAALGHTNDGFPAAFRGDIGCRPARPDFSRFDRRAAAER